MRAGPPRLRRRGFLAGSLVGAGLLAGCGDYDGRADPGGGQQPQGAALRITLGTQAFPEAKVLGELWRQALAANGFTVTLRKGVGPAADLDRLLGRHEIDGHVAYTGTVLSVVAHQSVSGLSPTATYERAKRFYSGRGMAMSAMTPFQNKDAIATTTTTAQQRDLGSVSDLRKLGPFTLGARPEFEDLQLGLKGLRADYGLDRARFEGVELGKQYAALDSGRVDAVDAFTTDPQLRSGDYTLLSDPKLLFGSQNVVMTVRKDKLKVVGGEKFLRVVSAVNRELNQDDIVELNAAVTEGQSDEVAAARFLRDHDLDESIGDDR